MIRTALSMIALLAACSPQANVSAAQPGSTQSKDLKESRLPEGLPEAVPILSLKGEWRVAGIDGKPFDEPYGLALSADSEEIWWAPRCAGLIRSYEISGTAVRFGPARALRAAPPGTLAPPVCAIGLPPRIDKVTRAIDSATTIGRTANNGVEISGGGHSLLLFSQ